MFYSCSNSSFICLCCAFRRVKKYFLALNCSIFSNKIPSYSKVRALSFSEDGSYLVTVGTRHVKFWYMDSESSLIKVKIYITEVPVYKTAPLIDTLSPTPSKISSTVSLRGQGQSYKGIETFKWRKGKISILTINWNCLCREHGCNQKGT